MGPISWVGTRRIVLGVTCPTPTPPLKEEGLSIALPRLTIGLETLFLPVYANFWSYGFQTPLFKIQTSLASLGVT